MRDPTPILVRARELIADPEHWTQDEYATDNTGRAVSPFDTDAYCFCTLGAIDRAVYEQLGGTIPRNTKGLDDTARVENHPLAKAAITKLQDLLGGRFVSDFNDEHEHPEILALLDKAIAQ
jgi:hypothetical protein